jgi:hypothetical protein
MANPNTASPSAASANRDLFALWTTLAETSLQTTFELQNTALASSQAWLESSAKALGRWDGVARQAQATTLRAYQDGARLLERVAPTPST